MPISGAGADKTGTADFDVIVIGGGPAGSTAAALLAREGRRVAIFDRDRWPRYHIGESLLPGVIPFLEELGALEAVEACGFRRKTGQTFRWGPNRTPWQLDFRQLDIYPYSYFVERADFDHALLLNAVRLGATLEQETSVEGLLLHGEQVRGVRVRGPDGRVRPVTARQVVDASGQAALISRHFDTRRWVKGLRNLAVWSYWEGAAQPPSPQDEHIFTVSTSDGWVWLLPLRNGRVSVGIVTLDWTREKKTSGHADLESWYEKTVRDTELIGEMLSGARRVEEVRAARDWSYCASRFFGPGYCLVGDAACFVDPILSTGIQLAMTGGYLAALAINSALAEPAHEEAFFRYYQQSYLTTYREQLTQIRYFYRTEAHRDSIFWKSKRLLRVDPQLDGALAFVFLNSGLARHVTSDRPHDTPGQARCLFGSIRDSPADAVGYRGKKAVRQLVPNGGFVTLEGADRRLYGVFQEGMRLLLRPARPRRWAERPEGTATLIEIEQADSAIPVGTLLFESAARGHDPGVRVSNGMACLARVYRGREALAEVLSEAAAAILALAVPGDADGLAAFDRRVREQLGAGSKGSWAFSRLPPVDSVALVEHPIAAEYLRESDGASVWIIAQTRREAMAHESPFLRTRYVDFDYYTGDGEPDRDGQLLVGAIVQRLEAAVAGVSTISGALDASQDAFGWESDLPLGWTRKAVRRMAPNRWADESLNGLDAAEEASM